MDKKDFIESPENQARRMVISAKLIKMGKSLLIEGKNNDDYCVLSVGNTLILLGGLILNSKDMGEFNNVCSMLTAKNILDDLMKSPIGGLIRSNMMAKFDGLSGMNGMTSENLDDINGILGLMGDNDDDDDDL